MERADTFLVIGLVVLVASACTDPDSVPPDGTTGGESTVDDGGSVGSDDGPTDGGDAPTGADESTSTGDSNGEVFDCATITDQAPPTIVLRGPQAGRGLAFDDLGHCIGVVEPSLVRATYGGPVEAFVPGLGDELDQIDSLPGGDFVVARFDTGTILRVTPEGLVSTIATDVFAYGVRTGPDGMVYTANSQVVHRIDPERSQKVEFVPASGFSPRVVDFSPDRGRMYIGTMESNGEVWVVELDEDLGVVGAPQLFYEGLGGWHDGLGVDACGYVYVSDYQTLSLFRISPDGSTVVTLLEADGTGTGDVFGHGLRWGSGVGGWKHDALYLPLPLRGDAVGEVSIGIPGRDWEGTILNPP